MSNELDELATAIDAVDGLESLPCDGEGHPIEDADACLHVRCTLKSPRREELLATVGPAARRAHFVMAALVDRRDLYSFAFKPGKRRTSLAEACEKLIALLSDMDSLASGPVPDRRGRV